jgi:hypothetical protein
MHSAMFDVAAWLLPGGGTAAADSIIATYTIVFAYRTHNFDKEMLLSLKNLGCLVENVEAKVQLHVLSCLI